MAMLNLVVALAAEARPLARHFHLIEDRAVTGFRVFRGEGVQLVVTGIGRVSCAAGVATLADPRAPGRRDALSAWLNVGIAGHASLDLGTGVRALSVHEAATGRAWYPAQAAALPGRGAALCTVDAPETRYPDDCVYDMEASAFCAIALRYSSSELVQMYKIISDNRANGVHTVDKHGIRDAMIDHLPRIDEMVEALRDLSGEVNAAQPRLAELDELVKRWHFTATQQHQLRELLRRWEVLEGGRPLLDDDLNRCPSAKSVLAVIGERLERVYHRPESGGD